MFIRLYDAAVEYYYSMKLAYAPIIRLSVATEVVVIIDTPFDFLSITENIIVQKI